MMRKFVLLSLLLAMFVPRAVADEGMWLLPYLNKLNINDMKAKGLKLEAEDIYSVNNSSIKDAIVIFGGGCTGELISSKGLVLTNHHCGYGAIQQHSTVENDYLKDGFWAMSFKEEIPTPGLKVTFIKSIEDVTSTVLAAIKPKMNDTERAEAIKKVSKEITSKIDTKNGMVANVQSMFGGNQFFLFVSQSYTDVRMVGAPPSSIGKFGGDTDNWMWPRHTGDFSLFRIYADKDGNPASYSADNVPLVPKKYLPISLQGVKEGDYAMILGFPGSTTRYMTSYEIDEVLDQDNPIRIKVRGLRQDVLMKDMKADPKVKIQYASKYAGSSNYWKNSIGKSRGLRKLNVKADKQAIENSFTEWVNADPKRQEEYGNALTLISESVKERMPAKYISSYYRESLGNIEIISAAAKFTKLLEELKKSESGKPNVADSLAKALKVSVADSYANINVPTDKKVAKAMIEVFLADVPKEAYPSIFEVVEKEANGSVDVALDYLYNNSIFASEEKLQKFLDNPTSAVLENDYAYQANKSFVEARNAPLAASNPATDIKYAKGHRLFVKGLMEMNPGKSYYPDANFTIRMTYGNVLPYSPADAVKYDYVTTLKGVLDKEDPTNAYEFTVPEKLKELYKKSDFGQYGQNGKLIVNFLTNNDITGGNSGSPVINGKGELVGTAFDGNWEAMSGDIAFEPALQRCISVDIRYTLFIIDKFAGATRLIDEMTIVK